MSESGFDRPNTRTKIRNKELLNNIVKIYLIDIY